MAEEKREQVSGKYLEYKGLPLVREGNTICYGDMSDKCVLLLEIMSYKEEGGEKVPDKILVQILDSKDPNNVIQSGQKNGLHDAFSLGVTWLDMKLKKSALE